jgi:hypothetical protein
MDHTQNTMVGSLTNKLVDMIIMEINKADMQVKIHKQIVNPVMCMIYQQLYPYIYAFVIVIVLIFFMMITLLVNFFIYLKR